MYFIVHIFHNTNLKLYIMSHIFQSLLLLWHIQSYYSVYGGTTAQYPMYGTGPAGGMITGAAAAAAAFYPYLQFGEGSGGAAATGYTSGQTGYGVNYPHHLFQYSAINSATGGYPQHYGASMSLAPTPALQSGLYFINKYLNFFFLMISLAYSFFSNYIYIICIIILGVLISLSLGRHMKSNLENVSYAFYIYIYIYIFFLSLPMRKSHMYRKIYNTYIQANA